MTINEFQIRLDICSGNELAVLKQHAYETGYGYMFIDSSNGQCYLLDKYGKQTDIHRVKRISYGAFCNYKSLKNVIIPDSVKNIGNAVFWNCTSLESIIIPNSVKSIGDYAFYNCTSLKEVVFKGKTIDQVKAMDYYPWAIKDIRIIKCK